MTHFAARGIVALLMTWAVVPLCTADPIDEAVAAAEQGNAEAQFRLGHLYYEGRGVSQDYAQAFIWTSKAAEQGLAAAQVALGTWYEKAADQGDQKAAASLKGLTAATGDQFAEQVRKADSTGVAITFLEHERQRISIDLVRNHKNATLTVGGKLWTQENIATFADENERKLQVLSDEMKRRGFVMAAGEYSVQTYVAKEGDKFSACAQPQEAFGPVTVVQDGSTIEFRDAGGKLSGYGVIVEATVAVVPGARDQVSPRALFGGVAGDRISLALYDRSPMVLNPNTAPALCRIGVLNKVGSQ